MDRVGRLLQNLKPQQPPQPNQPQQANLNQSGQENINPNQGDPSSIGHHHSIGLGQTISSVGPHPVTLGPITPYPTQPQFVQLHQYGKYCFFFFLFLF